MAFHSKIARQKSLKKVTAPRLSRIFSEINWMIMLLLQMYNILFFYLSYILHKFFWVIISNTAGQITALKRLLGKCYLGNIQLFKYDY